MIFQPRGMTMKAIAACAVLGLVALLGATGATAQSSVLRIGLAEDPDILDPTLARTYVGRIVFASLCGSREVQPRAPSRHAGFVPPRGNLAD
jgi:hypothetical protein